VTLVVRRSIELRAQKRQVVELRGKRGLSNIGRLTVTLRRDRSETTASQDKVFTIFNIIYIMRSTLMGAI
jgi:hypothetical protein